MIRRLFGAISLVSLLLCLATAVSWVRSYGVSDEMEWLLAGDSSKSMGALVKFCSASGGMDLEVHRFLSDIPLNPPPQIFEFQGLPFGTRWFHRQLWSSRATFFDFFWISDRGVRENPHLIEEKFFVATPHWFLVTITLLLPGAWVLRAIIRRCITAPGHCTVCRYDLTGNTSGTCPECGTPVAGKAEVKG